MSAVKTLLTAEEFDSYPFEEDKRYELDEGELIEMTKPAYLHNRVLKKMTVRLENFFEANPIAELLVSENLYALSPSIRRAPDLAIILGDRSSELQDAKVIHLIPEIAIEIISPSESYRSIRRKMSQYFTAGVKECWIVYPESREMEVWTNIEDADRVFRATDFIQSPLLPGLNLPLASIFA